MERGYCRPQELLSHHDDMSHCVVPVLEREARRQRVRDYRTPVRANATNAFKTLNRAAHGGVSGELPELVRDHAILARKFAVHVNPARGLLSQARFILNLRDSYRRRGA